MKLSPAERLLRLHGIVAPGQIDLEVIAFDQGVSVKRRPLTGCEARILGRGDRAIITVDNRQSKTRQRFSTAHELGHWHHHRGKTLVCRSTDIGNFGSLASIRERTADRFAANLLLPPYLFRPECKRFRESTFECIESLSRLFMASITSTAIQIVDHGPEIVILVCYGMKRRKWFRMSKGVPDHWFPKDFLDQESFAFDLLRSSARRSGRDLVPANTWFDDREASDFQVHEDSFKIADDEVLSVLVFKDDEALEERA